MFGFKFEVRTKKCPCKSKTVRQTNSYFNYSIVQSAVHWHEHMPSALTTTDQRPCWWCSAWTEPRQKLTAASDRQRLVWVTGKHVFASNPDPIVDRVEVWRVRSPEFVRTSNLKANIHIVPFQFVKNTYFKFLQGSVATLFRWSWKILSYFVANLSKTLHINFYQNRSSIVKLW